MRPSLHRRWQLRASARGAAVWLADELIRDPGLPAEWVNKQIAMIRFLGLIHAGRAPDPGPASNPRPQLRVAQPTE